MKIIYNYIRAWFWGIGSFHKITRVKHTLYIGDYQIYVDAIMSHPKSKIHNHKESLVKYLEYFFEKKYSNYKTIADGLLKFKDKIEHKSIKDFFEVCILSGIGDELHSYINKFEVKSLSDIRDEKISKLLSNQ